MIERTIYYYGDALETAAAKELALREQQPRRRRSLVRNTSAYDVIEPEECDRVVMLPSVMSWDRNKIKATYEPLGIPIERMEL